MLPLKPISLKIDLRVIKIRINTPATGVTLSHGGYQPGRSNKTNHNQFVTLVLVFRHLCSELRSDKLERQASQALLLWRQLNPPASLLPFRWYSCDTTHRGWRLFQTVARLGEHKLLDILRKIYLLKHDYLRIQTGNERINITCNLMCVIWYSLFFKKLQAPCFSFFIFFWRRASPPRMTCRQAP